jgi:hypothetical protein
VTEGGNYVANGGYVYYVFNFSVFFGRFVLFEKGIGEGEAENTGTFHDIRDFVDYFLSKFLSAIIDI